MPETCANCGAVIGKFLAALAKVKFLIIGQIDELAPDTVNTVCFLRYGEQLPGFSYRLQDTPCYQACRHRCRVIHWAALSRDYPPMDRTVGQSEDDVLEGGTSEIGSSRRLAPERQVHDDRREY